MENNPEIFNKHTLAKGLLGAAGFLVLIAGFVYIPPILITKGNVLSWESVSDVATASVARIRGKKPRSSPTDPVSSPTPTPIPTASGSFLESFTTNFTVEEAGSMGTSNHSSWWVNSGGYLYSQDSVGTTIMGALPALNPWRVAYSLSNPLDTENGYYPQNIFRLLNQGQWQNETIEAYFKIENDTMTDSPNRNASNGLLIMARYLDGNNLYYVGVRVDGTVIVKKKKNGTYYTLLQKPIPGISGTYNRTSSPNLLPHNTWIGIKTTLTNDASGQVVINEYLDIGKTGVWTLVGTVIDDGLKYGGGALLGPGYAGIRTDFMDVTFDDFQVTSQ